MFSRSPIPTCLMLLTWALLAATIGAAQTTWHVDDDAPNDTAPGDPTISDPLEDGSGDHPFDAIQEGIDAAVDGDTVLVADGTYTGGGNKNLNYAGKAITVRSENGPQHCVIDCAHTGRGFYFHDEETEASVVEGFTITKGSVTDGGAIRCDEASPTIASCILVANAAENGGAIFCDLRHSSPMVRNCLIAANTAVRGGGAYLRWSAATLINCSIVRNQADVGGGGLKVVVGSNVTIANCILSDDQAPRGPEIDLWSTMFPSTLTVSYSDVHGGESVIYVREGCTLIWEDSSIDSDPLLRDPACADYRLQPGSPCVDGGTNDPAGGLPARDLDGVPRPLDGDGDLEPWSGQFETADMGAYEYEYGPPTTAMICRVPTTFNFVGRVGEADPDPETFSIWNCGIGTLDWEIAEDCLWLEVQPNAGESDGELDEVIISVSIAGLPRGDYACTFEISDAAAANSPQPVHVNLRLLGILHVPSEFPTIQAAIDASVDGEIVLVADGTYSGEGNKNLNFGGRAITVCSENGPENCIIDCDNDGRGFIFGSGETADAVVEGFSITNGGAGVLCSESSPRIISCTITNTHTGVYCSHSSPTTLNCTITGNLMGILGLSEGCLRVIGCRIRENTDGGVFAEGADVFVAHCVITENQGGGVWCQSGDTTITNCLIAENTARDGAGYCGGDGDATITNCTITGNTAESGGGVSFFNDCTATIANCILYANAATCGAEIALFGSSFYSPTLTAAYCDVEGGEAAVYVEGDCTLTWGDGNIDADPLFVDPNEANYHLSAGSPCVDAGCNCAVPEDVADLDGDGDIEEYVPFDLDGEGRFFDDPDTADTGSGVPPIVDMGAYEFGGSDLPPCHGDLDADRDVDLDDLAVLLAHYGMLEGANGADGDMDCDGDIQIADLAELLGMFGNGCE
jgi:hypothetical protein